MHTTGKRQQAATACVNEECRAQADDGVQSWTSRAGHACLEELDGAGTDEDVREDGRMVDALALAAEEGRGHAAKCSGEALAACDPEISEWGNPVGRTGVITRMEPGGHRGN